MDKIGRDVRIARLLLHIFVVNEVGADRYPIVARRGIALHDSPTIGSKINHQLYDSR
jgi:hypothetical protein